MIKRVLAIHDISCVGKCSSTVALPVISAAGIECSLLPTALLSTHTGGFTNYTFLDLTKEIKKIFRHFESLDLSIDAFYSGYLGDKKQINFLIKKIKAYKKTGTTYICDPVMADNGKLYPAFDEDFVSEIRKLVSYSDVVIPNLTEASFLLNKEFKNTYSKEEIKSILNELCDLGPKTAIITGVSFKENELGVMAYDSITEEYYEFYTEKIPGYYHGTGDLISSAIVGCILNDINLQKTLQISTIFTFNTIKQAYDDKLEPRYGVEFEKFLYDYSKSIKKEIDEWFH